jgi:riboflavin synthase
MAGKIANFDIMAETLKRTDLGSLAAGSRVNLERSLKVGDRMGGHFVLGHVVGLGTIRERKAEGDNCAVTVGVPRELTAFLMPKGSVAIDGISLTLTGITPAAFSVALIPHTLRNTTLGFKKKGDTVNIEVDYIGKWIKSLVPKKLIEETP